MKITKLDGRYTANRRWGFAYSVEFPANAWKKYFALKKQAHDLYGPSIDIGRKYIWRDEADILRSGPWAYKYVKSSADTNIYFRKEDDMNQAVMMYALTNTA